MVVGKIQIIVYEARLPMNLKRKLKIIIHIDGISPKINWILKYSSVFTTTLYGVFKVTDFFV